MAGKPAASSLSLAPGQVGAQLSPSRSLAGRLLWLTVLFVLLAEFLILIPAMGDFRDRWLSDRVAAAETAALARDVAQGEQIAADIDIALRRSAAVLAIAVKREGERQMVLGPDQPIEAKTLHTVDLRASTRVGQILGALRTLTVSQKRTLRILAAPRILQGEFIEVLVPEAPLKEALWAYAIQTLWLSVIVSIATGALVFWTLARQIVFPIRRLTGSIEAFRAAPEDESRSIRVSGRTDEIGRAEAALADMEQELRGALRSRERLAQLGGAVARINHDLRNTLAAAQIVSERLAQSQDPKVRQAAPRLERALERAIGLAEATLRYGRAEEPAPVLDLHEVRPLLEEAAREALEGHCDITVDLSAPMGLLALADADYMHRILLNLLRNAVQALAGRPGATLTLSARPARDAVIITLADNGPGVPPKVQERLFQPFASGNRAGGAGLGLAIARELARTLGGDLRLARTGPGGTEFQLRLPSAGAANAPPLAAEGDA